MPSGKTVDSSGVQELIARLRDEGVAAGQSEAERLIADARLEAIELRDTAQAEADEILAAARAEADRLIRDGEQALRLASRDVLLQVREACYSEFEKKLRKLVGFTLKDPQFLQKMILEIVRQASPKESPERLQVLLPNSEVTAEELTREIDDVQPGSLAAFVLGLTADILRDGLSFDVSRDDSPGVKLQMVDQDVKLELSDKTITKLLLRYLAPRYRAILEKDN